MNNPLPRIARHAMTAFLILATTATGITLSYYVVAVNPVPTDRQLRVMHYTCTTGEECSKECREKEDYPCEVEPFAHAY